MSILAKVLPCLTYFHVDDIAIDGDKITIVGTAKRAFARCPLCGHRSRSVHSWYARGVSDLPLGRTALALHLRVRRFFCRVPSCPRRIFTERFPDFVAPHSRRSEDMRRALQHIGLALGGEAGARLARRLSLPTGPTSVLRLMRQLPLPDPGHPHAVGIDEWAWRRGLRYGTVIVDLERHRPIALLPERNADLAAAWFATQPQLDAIARDRSDTFANAATRGAPQATQIADRFHLCRNLGDALEAFLLHKRTLLKETAASVADTVAPAVVSIPWANMYPGTRKEHRPQAWTQRAEGKSRRRHERRVAAYDAVCDLHAKGADIADIARTVGVSRRTVYRYVGMGSPPERKRPGRRVRPERAAYEAYLVRRWNEGCHNGRRLWRELRALGHTCGETTVARFVAGLRRGEPVRRPTRTGGAAVTSAQGPTARHVALLLLRRPGHRTREEQAYMDELCRRDAPVAAAAALARDFMRMVRDREGASFDAWIAAATASESAEVRRFATGLTKDEAAVRAGLTLEYSNGQVEGQITRLKLIRRSMYGRGRFDLLQRRVLHVA